MSKHQEGSEVSKEIARRSEIVMLELNISFMRALGIILKRYPKLFKEYIKEVSPGLLSDTA